MLALAAEELDVDVPTASEVPCRRGHFDRLGAALLGQHAVNPVRHDLVVAGLHHPGGDRDRECASSRHLGREPPIHATRFLQPFSLPNRESYEVRARSRGG